MRFRQMSRFGTAVSGTNHNVDMETWLSLRIVGHVPDKRRDLYLLANRNFVVFFFSQLK